MIIIIIVINLFTIIAIYMKIYMALYYIVEKSTPVPGTVMEQTVDRIVQASTLPLSNIYLTVKVCTTARCHKCTNTQSLTVMINRIW